MKEQICPKDAELVAVGVRPDGIQRERSQLIVFIRSIPPVADGVNDGDANPRCLSRSSAGTSITRHSPPVCEMSPPGRER